MTHEEAIEFAEKISLTVLDINVSDKLTNDALEFSEVVIEALEKQISLVQILNDVEQAHPYKVVGDFDTYSQYNEGWTDAVNYIRSRLE